VQNEADLRRFLRRIEQYLEFFAGEIGGRAATPFEVKALAERWGSQRDTEHTQKHRSPSGGG
jgi:hypothetical protein